MTAQQEIIQLKRQVDDLTRGLATQAKLYAGARDDHDRALLNATDLKMQNERLRSALDFVARAVAAMSGARNVG